MSAENRKLLEMAAKAAGYVPVRMTGDGMALLLEGVQERWSPLTDDGDEARLEAVLHLNVSWWQHYVEVRRADFGYDTFRRETYAKHAGDKQAARRRAGVRVAAAIGEAMP